MRNRPHMNGFTLIEVMVAIAIFAVLSAGIYRVLSAMAETQIKVVKHAEALHDIQKAMWVMTADIEQVVRRDVHADYDDRLPAMISDEGDYLLQFTRQGISNPLLLNRSDMARVAYSVGPEPEREDGKQNRDKSEAARRHLLRHTWTALDRIPDTKVMTQILLPDVESVKMEFLVEEKKWIPRWPEDQPDRRSHVQALPLAIKIIINTKNEGEIQRFFQIGNLIKKEEARP